MLSLNLHRRHLSPAQSAMCAARAKSVYEEQAKQRQQAATIKGNKTRHEKDESPVPENLPELAPGDSRDAAGKAFGVSGRSVEHATGVIEKGIPELVKAVDAGQMAISKAARIANESEDTQRKELQNLGAPKPQEESEDIPDEPDVCRWR